MFFDPIYFVFLAPAILLGLWAQARVRSAYAAGRQMRAGMTGAEAARRVLDSAGLRSVRIEQVPGELTDHYDPRDKVLRLSSEVYSAPTIAAVGIAAHEAGHALQDAQQYAPMTVRAAALPVANFGGGFAWIVMALGVFLHTPALVMAGIALFSAVVFFELVNLPVEFNASARAKTQLVELGIIHPRELGGVNDVLDAAAWTYVAHTLQTVAVLVYYFFRFGGALSGDRR